jgi:hypothetical protein
MLMESRIEWVARERDAENASTAGAKRCRKDKIGRLGTPSLNDVTEGDAVREER